MAADSGFKFAVSSPKQLHSSFAQTTAGDLKYGTFPFGVIQMIMTVGMMILTMMRRMVIVINIYKGNEGINDKGITKVPAVT